MAGPAWSVSHTEGEIALTIAVTTPTGHVGSHVARMLCQAGVRPRLLLRDPDRLDPEVRDRAELAVGDQRDAAYVAEATRGVEAVFWVHPDDWSLPDPDADAERTGDWTGRQVQAVHGPADLTWTEAAAALSTATGVAIEAQRISDDEERAALRAAGMSERWPSRGSSG